jgi:hypothetical protein
MASRTEQLHREDFYAWTRQQAAALRRLADERWNGPLDLLISPRRWKTWAASSSGRRKLSSSALWNISSSWSIRRAPTPGVNGWFPCARGEIGRRLTPTIRNQVEPALSDLYRPSRRNAELSLLDHEEAEAARALPADCPYAFDDLLADEWWPANRHGRTDEL